MLVGWWAFWSLFFKENFLDPTFGVDNPQLAASRYDQFLLLDSGKNAMGYATELCKIREPMVDGNQKFGFNSPVEVGSLFTITYDGF